MAPHKCNEELPCLMPPAPDYLERLLREAREGGESDGAQGIGGHGEDLVVGFNDGAIFPPEEFSSGASDADMSRAALTRQPHRGDIRALVVLVEFPDKRMVSTKQHFEDLFFSEGKIPTQSVTEYYRTVSNGKITLKGEVLGPYMMPQPITYYSRGRTGTQLQMPNIRTMGADALAAVRNHVNFDPYDNDGSGYVDAFTVVHAGSGAEESQSKDDIWSVKWVLPNKVQVNNVNVWAFLTIPDDARLGVCAHELGHLLFGWPDLYDTTYMSKGVGDWCLMAGGSWTGTPRGTVPCHPSAWCKKTQGWVDVENETENRAIRLPDVKDCYRIHRLWTQGTRPDGDEYFLLENRQKKGFDTGIPGDGLLIWHIDDAMRDNSNRRRYKVGLVQADGKNLLATMDGGVGDPGNPFPGTYKNTRFTVDSNPSSRSHDGNDTLVAVTDIPDSAGIMIFNIAVGRAKRSPDAPTTCTYTPVYRRDGIGGYDLRSRADLAFAFDYTGSGKQDHLVFYRPGTGTCWILANDDGQFSPTFQQGDPGSGIGGFDLQSPADRAFAFDYTSSGKLDHLVFYRPGHGAIFILKNESGTFSPVYAQGAGGSGIGGFDLRSPADRMFAFDYRGTGKLDHLAVYRPGYKIFWILRNTGGTFTPVYQSDSGIGGFTLSSPDDRAFAYDWSGTGKRDHIALYRPGKGMFWCLKRNGAEFGPVMDEGTDEGQGIGGYNLKDTRDVCFAFDFDGDGKDNYVAAYRPGTGTFWVLKHGGGKNFEAVIHEGDPGKGVGGFTLGSNEDKVFSFDFDHSGKEDHLVCYRTDGSGTIWILKRA